MLIENTKQFFLKNVLPFSRFKPFLSRFLKSRFKSYIYEYIFTLSSKDNAPLISYN